MTQSTEEHPPSMDGVLSQKHEIQLTSLLAIKDDIIGHSIRKSLYINQKFMRPLLDLLQSDSTPPDIKIEATTVLGSLFHGLFPSNYLPWLTFRPGNQRIVRRHHELRDHPRSHRISRPGYLFTRSNYCLSSRPQHVLRVQSFRFLHSPYSYLLPASGPYISTASQAPTQIGHHRASPASCNAPGKKLREC